MATTELHSTTAGPGEGRAGYLQTDPDGYVFDPESGEVHGVTDPETGAVVWLVEAGQDVPQDAGRFEIRSREAADWVLKLRMEEEAALLALEAKKSALLANLEGQAVHHRNRLKGLAWRFDNDLAEFARQELAARHGAGKTLKLTFGSIAFRQTKGSAEVTDPAAALDYVREWAPERIVPKPVGVEAVKAAIEAERAADQEPDVAGFFRQAEPRESCSIRTGIGK